jgi:predicted transcriptional regulator
MTEKIIEILRSIGLNKNEVKIFLDLMKRDSSSALEISKRTEIHRSNVYDSLRVLMEKGFVSELTDGKKKLFQALDPSRIKEYILQKEREIDSIIPNLRQISARKVSRGNVLIHQGVFALRGILMKLLDLGEEIVIYGISEGLRETLGYGFLEEFHDNRVQKGVMIRNIYTKEAFGDDVVKLGNKDLIEVRWYKQRENRSNVFNIVCGEKVFIVVFGDVISIIEISAREVADFYRIYFEILWGYARRD